MSRDQNANLSLVALRALASSNCDISSLATSFVALCTALATAIAIADEGDLERARSEGAKAASQGVSCEKPFDSDYNRVFEAACQSKKADIETGRKHVDDRSSHETPPTPERFRPPPPASVDAISKLLPNLSFEHGGVLKLEMSIEQADRFPSLPSIENFLGNLGLTIADYCTTNGDRPNSGSLVVLKAVVFNDRTKEKLWNVLSVYCFSTRSRALTLVASEQVLWDHRRRNKLGETYIERSTFLVGIENAEGPRERRYPNISLVSKSGHQHRDFDLSQARDLFSPTERGRRTEITFSTNDPFATVIDPFGIVLFAMTASLQHGKPKSDYWIYGAFRDKALPLRVSAEVAPMTKDMEYSSFVLDIGKNVRKKFPIVSVHVDGTIPRNIKNLRFPITRYWSF